MLSNLVFTLAEKLQNTAKHGILG